jgi:hypothetical protein
MTLNKMHYKRDEPCPCGSGVVYKFCHQEIFEAKPEDLLDAGHRQYVKTWSKNAVHYSKQGYYQELANELAAVNAPERVLEIGCEPVRH